MRRRRRVLKSVEKKFDFQKREKKAREKKIQKKNHPRSLSPTNSLFVCLFLTFNEIQTNHRVISFSCSLSLLFSLETKSALSKALGVLFCSFCLLLRFSPLFFHSTTRESEIYIHTEDTTNNVATDDDERTISKSKVGTVLRAL